MNKRSRTSRIVGSTISLVISVLIAMVLFSIAEESKQDWRYYWDEEFQTQTDFAEIGAWLFAFFAVVDCVMLIVHLASRDDSPAGHNLMPCPDCRSMVSRNAISCPRCGRVIRRQTTAERSGQLRPGEWRCVCGRTNAGFVSTCPCGNSKHMQLAQEKKMAVKWWSCETCGSENPPGASHCTRCGAAKSLKTSGAPHEVICCPECGEKIPDTTRFCPVCGTRQQY